MKKIFTYFAAIGLAVLTVLSCQTVPEDNSHTDVVIPAPAVTITVSDISDDSATITIAPESEAAYFSYLIDDSDEAEELDPAALYANKYSSVASGVVKYDAENKPSVTVELKDLDPNVKYQIYAVAGSTSGVVGEIAVKSFITSDTGLPGIDDTAKKENIYQVQFTEAVTYNDKTPVTAKYYAANAIIVDDSGDKPVLTFDGEQGDADVAVAVQGNVAQFTVTLDGENPLPNGAYYAINIPEGAFEDAVGNKLPAVPIVNGLTSSGTLGFAGIFGRVSTVPFNLEPDEEKATLAPSETSVVIGFPEDVDFFDFASTAAASIKVETTSSSKSSVVDYKLSVGTECDYSPAAGVVITLPADFEAGPGSNLTFTIAEGSLLDIYGNGNAELSFSYLYSYGYSLEDIVGTYQNAGESGYGPTYNEDPWTIIIEESDDESKGNVMVTSYYGFDCKIYADFDMDMGTFTMPIDLEFLNYTINTEDNTYTEFYTFGYYSTSKKEGNPLILAMTESGTFTDANDYLGYYYEIYALPASGNPEEIDWDNDFLDYDYNIFIPVPMSKVSAAPLASIKIVRESPVVEKTTFKRIR